jgi:hypothetical protein
MHLAFSTGFAKIPRLLSVNGHSQITRYNIPLASNAFARAPTIITLPGKHISELRCAPTFLEHEFYCNREK